MPSHTEKQIIKTLEHSGVADYIQYLKSPWRIFWTNLLAGISRGLGIILGMTVVLGVSLWVLSQMESLPVIGEYFGTIQNQITEYAESTNYSEEFQEMQGTLSEIRDSLQR